MRLAFGKLGQLREFEHIIDTLRNFSFGDFFTAQTKSNIVPNIQMRE